MSNSILLFDEEAARLLRMTPRQLIRLAREGLAPCVILPDGEVRFLEDDLRAWVENHKRPAVDGGDR